MEKEQAILEFPEVFGLKAFPGQRFKINESASYVIGKCVILYVFTEAGEAFCKGSPRELKRNVVTL